MYQKIAQLTERKKCKLAFMHDLLAARLRHQAWQRSGGVKLDSVAAALGLAARLHSAASSGHGRASRHQCRAATARHCGGDEDTGGESDCGGTNNQQSTKRTETTTMTGQLGAGGGSLALAQRQRSRGGCVSVMAALVHWRH